MSAPIALPLHDPSQWPLRLTADEVAYVSRRSRRWLHRRVKAGQFPDHDSDGLWARDTVVWYQKNGIKELDALKDREARVAAVRAAVQTTAPARRRQFLKKHRPAIALVGAGR